MISKKLDEIYETIGGSMNKEFKNLSIEQIDWLMTQAEKLKKLHFDLTQSKKIGGYENIKIDYLLSAIESDKY